MATKKRFSGSMRAEDSTYSGNLNSARRLERQDFSMISEDKSACANLPQQVMYKPWPKGADYADYALDDTIKGVNEQERADVSGMKRHKGGTKY